jgi:PhnB protein
VVQPIPEGYNTITPYLAVDDAAAAIDFYTRAFGAKERYRMPMPDGKVAHAELEIGDSVVMLSDPFPGGAMKTPKEAEGTTAAIFMYVEDCDAAHRRAVEAGATSTQEPEDMFWGDRFARVTDPFGHSWQFATHVEDVSPEEMEERSRKAMAEMGAG